MLILILINFFKMERGQKRRKTVNSKASAQRSREKRQREAAMRVLNQVPSGNIGRELKFHTFSIAPVELGNSMASTDGNITPAPALALNAIADDSTATTRIGNKIKMRSIFITGHIGPGAALAADFFGDPIVYVALVLDLRNNAASSALEASRVWLDKSGSSLAVSPLRNMEQSSRFGS